MYLLVTFPISWNMFAAFVTLSMSHISFMMLMQTHLTLYYLTMYIYHIYLKIILCLMAMRFDF